MSAKRRPALRVADETDVPSRPLTISEAASSGGTRDILVAMRDRVATAVEDPNTPPRDLAALSKRLMEIVRDIEAIDARAVDRREDGAADVIDGAFDASAV